MLSDDDFPLGRQLDDLADHLTALIPAGNCAVAIYCGNGRRLAKVGPSSLSLPSQIDVPTPGAQAGTGLPPRSASRAASVTALDGDGDRAVSFTYIELPGDAAERFILAVAAPFDTDRATLMSLCKLGAWFLAREFDLLTQAHRLRQVVQEQEAVIDHISDGLMVIDRSGSVRYMNQHAGRILSLDPRESVGRPLRDLLDFEPVIEPIFVTGEGYIDRELQIDSPRRRLQLVDTAVPIRNERGEVVSVVNTFREMARVRRLSQRMVGDQARYRFSDITGEAKPLRDAVDAARRAARADASVLIYGESGTGKELFAQAMHADGKRAAGPFVAINCAALPRDLIESELFGYAPSSFTGADRTGRPGKFELASGGTIFLDEISEMPLDVQAKLLRVLQERQVTRIGGTRSVEVDARVIAAANLPLRDLVAQKRFREDLYYRLNVIRLDIPPLRDRIEDIDRLADDLIRRYCAALHRPSIQLTAQAKRQLRSYDWPGNIRQLQNVMERLVNLTDAHVVNELPSEWLEGSPTRVVARSPAGHIERTMTLEEAERQCIRLSLEATEFNITHSAEMLGITRPTLYAKMKRYGLALKTRLLDDRGVMRSNG